MCSQINYIRDITTCSQKLKFSNLSFLWAVSCCRRPETHSWKKTLIRCISFCPFKKLQKVKKNAYSNFSLLFSLSILSKSIMKQKAFRECRHLHVCDLWPWVVTLTLSEGLKGLCHSMSLIVLYLGTRYDVCEYNSLRDMTISSFMWPLILTSACDLHRLSRSL